MNDAVLPSREQLDRELQYYRTEYNALGAQMVRVQEQLSLTVREARRSKIVARLIRDAYAIGSRDLGEDDIGEPILSIVADNSICDQAMLFIRDEGSPNLFRIEHALGGKRDGYLTIDDPPDFLFTSSAHSTDSKGKLIGELMAVPYLLWSYNAASGRALLLGKRTEGNIHRAFEAGDREIVEVALAIYEDVLLRKRAEAALLRAKKIADDANEARARFLANLSHELRTPLNAIIGFAEILSQAGKDTAPPEQRQEYAQLILDAGRNLGALARDILDFSALSHARPQLRIAWLAIDYLFTTAARSVSAQSLQVGVDVKILPFAPGLEVAIDYDRFRQILSNLLANALKFTPAGGYVEISVEYSEGDTIALRVRDNGIGMAPEDIHRALEPFVQLDKSAAHGAGLGLPITLQLVEAHGGTLRLESKIREGTSVVIILPPHSWRLNC